MKRKVYDPDGRFCGYYLVFDQGVVAYSANPGVESVEFDNEVEAEAWLRAAL